MKTARLFTKTLIFLWMCMMCFIVLTKAQLISEEERILQLFNDSPVFAMAQRPSVLLASRDGKTEEVGQVQEGATVEIIKDYGTLWYFVKDVNTGHKGWLKGDVLWIPEDPKTNTEPVEKTDLEAYVNTKNLQSKTHYLLFTEIDRQMTYVFTGKQNQWKLKTSFVCATGKNVSPTTRGVFEVKGRGKWFYSERLQSGAKYYVGFHGSYLFHSVVMDKKQNITDEVLGERRSSGCVRLSVSDAKWIFDNIPDGTAVFVN